MALFLLTGAIGQVSATAAKVELIRDGGFELGNGPSSPWLAYQLEGGSACSAEITDLPNANTGRPNARSGRWYGYICDRLYSDADAIGVIRQDGISIPVECVSLRLRFTLHVISADSVNPDANDLSPHLRNINDELLATFGHWTANLRDPAENTANYLVVETDYAVPPTLRGQAGLLLQFYGETDGTPCATFRIDNVSLLAISGTCPLPSAPATLEPGDLA